MSIFEQCMCNTYMCVVPLCVTMCACPYLDGVMCDTVGELTATVHVMQLQWNLSKTTTCGQS